MSATTERLTISDFETRYREEKPYYEFWRGEAIQKSIPGRIHGLLQIIVGELLKRAGFSAASEVKLRIDLDLQLIPDVIATRGNIALRYPTAALEIVVDLIRRRPYVSYVDEVPSLSGLGL